jgi:hypothetical protein
VILLGPISPVHLSSLELRDLRLGLENGPERSKIYIFIAPGVDTVHMIDDVATHQRSTPLRESNVTSPRACWV